MVTKNLRYTKEVRVNLKIENTVFYFTFHHLIFLGGNVILQIQQLKIDHHVIRGRYLVISTPSAIIKNQTVKEEVLYSYGSS